MAIIVDRIQVQNFRSIRSIDVSNIDEYLPVVGLNSSGKSNLLRALSLFFTDSVDDTGDPVNLIRDYSGYAPKGKRKEISVGVELRLEGVFHVRGQRDFLDEHGISDRIGIRRTWFLESGSATVTDRLEFGPSLDSLQEAVTRASEASVMAFVRAVEYRYVPNHVRPVDIMSSMTGPIRKNLMTRLQATREYRDSSPDVVMGALERTARRMFDEVSSKIQKGIPGLAMEPMLPETFADLAFELLLATVSGDDVSRTPELEGSGAQSFMLLHVMDLADRATRGQSFGWVQGAIWAFEEPESYLHSGLRFKYADDLRSLARDDRRQIFLTTHQDEFISVSDHALMAQPTAVGTTSGTTVNIATARNAIQESAKNAVSVYRHPLADRPNVPLVIVEGKHDKAYIDMAVIHTGLRPRWRVVCNESLDLGGGGDGILAFLRANSAALSARPLSGPVIVLRDWEATDAARYIAALRPHPHSTCLTAPRDLCNPGLGEKFVGIERYLETGIITSTIPGRHLSRSLEAGDETLQVDRNILEKMKSRLESAVRESGSVGEHLEALVRWLDGQVENTLTQVPPEEFVLG